MHDWLLKKDEYRSAPDRIFFIDKSILSIVSRISRLKREERSSTSFFYTLNPGLKFLTTVALVIMISFLRDFSSVVLLFSYFLLSLALIDISEIKKIIGIAVFAFISSAVILTPSVLMGNFLNSLIICIKVVSTVMAVNIFAYTTKNQDVTRSIKTLRVPDILILVFDITIKYIVVVGDIAVNMLNSLKIRSIGKNNHKVASLGNIIGFLFIKSKKFSEDIYSSMLCRGFNGEYTIKENSGGFGFYDYIYIVVNTLLIAGVLI